MKRRKLLTAAGAIAGVTLTGCGGGAETAAGEPGSEIGAYTIPGPLVPQNGHYQVEVVFGLQVQTEVKLLSYGSSVQIDPLASKTVTGTGSHKVGFAKLRVTNEPGRNYERLQLAVTQHWKDANNNDISYTHYAGAGPGGSAANIKYTYYPETDEYEWQFYSADPASVGYKRMFCAVRFFRLPLAEFYTFTDVYLKVVPNNASVENLNGYGTSWSQHLPTIYNYSTTHESRAGKDPKKTHADTVAIQDQRQPLGYKMLVPTLYHASPELRPMLERHLTRQMQVLGKKQATVTVMDGVEDKDQGHLLSNELLRMLGGETLIENMRNYKQQLFDQAASLFSAIGSDIEAFCQQQLPSFVTEDMAAGQRRVLAEAEQAGQIDSNGAPLGFSAADTVAVQMAGSCTYQNWPFPGCDLGAGIRISFPLLRGSVAWAREGNNPNPKRDVYSTGYLVGRDPFNFQVVGIIKLINAVSLLSIDVEFTVNLYRAGRKLVMQSVVFDPVIDLDLRSICGRLAAAGIAAASAQAPDPAVSAAFNFAPSSLGGLEAGVSSAASAATRSSELVPTYELPAAVRDAIRNSLDSTGREKISTSFNVLEISPLRFKWGHRDILNLTEASPFWTLGDTTWGWCPGVKHIGGAGWRVSKNIPVGTSSIAFNGYLRMVNTFDFGMMVGSDDFFRSQHLIMN